MLKIIVPAIGFVLIFFANNHSFESHIGFTDEWTLALEEEFLQLEQRIDKLRQYPSKNDYDKLRHQWERLAWLSPLASSEGVPTYIDNNRHWQIDEAVVSADYPEAGALQKIEYQVGQIEPDTSVIFTSLREFSSFISTLKNTAIDHWPGNFEVPQKNDRLAFLLSTELYRQFTLQLSGHFRLHQPSAVDDAKAFFASLRKWGQLLGLDTKPAWKKRLRLVQNVLRRSSFTSLDRMDLYTAHLRPLYQLMVTDIDLDACSQYFNLPGAVDGELFSWQWFSTQRPPLTSSQINLGRLLFFDPLLSGNWRRSCASCHQPSKAFTDGRATSMAFDFPKRINRNAPSLVNAFINSDQAGHALEKTDVEHFLQSVFDHTQELRIT
ncbi:MAG: cytochrome-c peroxidase, partial [Bacteroidota bacterium]